MAEVMSVRDLNLFGDMLRCEQSSVDMEVEMEKKEERSEERRITSKDCSGSDMRWEDFIPRNVVRVLLVEADDSTRQIISAFLRKCNYKVAAVADGLKAWEVLKEKPHKIDLILTEVELPSISGFSLLTLIMDDDLCKNIPVIMMSSHDSIGTVYKCMMRGASDFLMKPVRINELKNVWQHIWRRKSVCGVDPQIETVTPQKDEASAENDDTSDRYSDSLERSPVQSSCMNLDSEESQEPSGSEKMQSPAIDDEKTATTADSSREAIDFIGTFDNKDRYVDQQQSNNRSEVFESPALNLSLRRSEDSELGGFESEASQSNALIQSDGSAFSCYNNERSGSLPSEVQVASPSEEHRPYPIRVVAERPVCHKQERKVESVDEKTSFSTITDQSGSDSLSSGALSNPHRSVQREAALTKFRLKRKERCFDKKVRYESRKKLADQRPRVKGQFVRRIPDSPSPANPVAACASAGDYLANERPFFYCSVNY